MVAQTLTIGNRRFVLVPEPEFRRLQKRAGQVKVRSKFGQDAMKTLREYKKTGKAVNWREAKRKLGL